MRRHAVNLTIPPRLQTLHFYGSFWPHDSGFNKLNLESQIPESVFKELQARGHDVNTIKPFSIASCATAVMIDPNNGNRIPGPTRAAIATPWPISV